MDCRDAVAAAAEKGRAFVCVSSPGELNSLASLGMGMLRRKVESTMVIKVFFILTSGCNRFKKLNESSRVVFDKAQVASAAADQRLPKIARKL
jgi:hypothetical protein